MAMDGGNGVLGVLLLLVLLVVVLGGEFVVVVVVVLTGVGVVVVVVVVSTTTLVSSAASCCSDDILVNCWTRGVELVYCAWWCCLFGFSRVFVLLSIYFKSSTIVGCRNGEV